MILYIAQGGIGIKRSLDALAAKYMKFDDLESPRLVSLLLRLLVESHALPFLHTFK